MKKEKCHFIGIGGIGMSGLARLLLGRNVEVSGSDLGSNYVTEGLIREGAKVFVGHSSKNITSDMTVIYTTGIHKENPEFQTAKQLQCPLLHRSDLLEHLMRDYRTLAVAGTHGKTTTSGLLATVLCEAGLDPAFAIGGILPGFSTNAKDGKGSYFVAEACESDGTFLKYKSYGAIVTNIDLDHMDFFKTEEELVLSFAKFIRNVSSSNHFFWCGDDSRLKQLSPAGTSYGFGSECRLRISGFVQKNWSISFNIDFEGKTYKNIQLPLTGKHNALNAAAVFGLCLRLGISEEAIRKAFLTFKSVARRCEKKGEIQNILFLDDYAHHPSEINTTLRGIRNAIGERRMIVVYQPHRYSRTLDCLEMFSEVFDSADVVILTDIYAAGETPVEGLTIHKVLETFQKDNFVPIRYVSNERLEVELAGYLRPHDVLVTIGAGNITYLSGRLIERIKQHSVKKYRVGVIFGGLSLEHEISMLSARHIVSSLKKDLYDIEYFGIAKNGQWVSGSKALEFLEKGKTVEPETNVFISAEDIQRIMNCDILFPVLHGPFGEDGTIQGFFEMLGKAYVGAGHRASAICMDKILTKQLMNLHGIATPDFIGFSKYEWDSQREEYLEKIATKLNFPLFVKPIHLGSSVGVSKVAKMEDLEFAVKQAFKVDTHVLVENGHQVREIEFAVLGNDKVEVFPPGEILTNGQVYDYENKYGENAMEAIADAKLTPKQIQDGMALARQAYQIAGCVGMARVDTFLDKNGKFWLNEINPIPGFTKISLYPRMCAAHGLSSPDLVDRLIVLGLHRKRQQDYALKNGVRQSMFA